MGIPMANIHLPSVASGPTSNGGLATTVMPDPLSLRELIAEKDRVESELRALSSVLSSVNFTLHLEPRYDLTRPLLF